MTKDRITKKHGITKYDVVFLVMLLALTAFSIWKAPRGYGGNDECFYLTIPYRLLQGDGLIVNEWHVSQLSGILLLPIMKVYQLLGGTGEGIILKFRYIYIVVQALCGVCIYLILRGRGEKKNLGALCAAAVFLPYAPCYIMALSYNSMGIMALILSGTVIATANKQNWRFLVGGVLFAVSVLSCPYLIVVYILYTIILIINYARDKKRGYSQRAGFIARSWLMFTIGAAAIALVFAVFLLTRCEAERFVGSIKGMFTDPKHSNIPFSIKVRMYIDMLFIKRGDVMFSLGTIAMLLVYQLYENGGKESRAVFLTVVSVFTVVFLLYSDHYMNYVNFLNIALNYAGVCTYILNEEKETDIFRFVFVPGVLYSFLIHLGSNMEIYCMTSALNVASVASAYFIGCMVYKLLNEKNRKSRIAAGFLILCVITQSMLTVKERTVKSYSGFEGSNGRRMTDEWYLLYSKVEQGAYKGLYIMEDEHYDYKLMLEATDGVRNAEAKSIVYYAHYPWLYLMDEKENGAFSAWMSVGSSDSAIERLLMYWDINPEKIPDIIFIDKDAVGAERAVTELNIADYRLTETEDAYILQ